MNRGVIYFATGERFIREAQNSAQTLKKHNPALPMVLFTDVDMKPGVFDKVEKITPKGKMVLKQKCFVFGLTPFTETLFIDTDTMVLGDVTQPFELLKQHDFALAAMRWLDFDQVPPRLVEFEKPHPVRPDLKILNTGVMYYRMNERVRSFLESWANRIHDERSPKGQPKLHDDQETLNLMLGENEDKKRGVSFQIIPNTIYNCRNLFFPRLRREGRMGQIVIRHEHGLFDSVWVRGCRQMRKKLSNLYRKAIKAKR